MKLSSENVVHGQMHRRRVLLLTSSFPFRSGEQFIGDEILHWAQRSDVEVLLMPLNADGVSRELPPSIHIDTQLASDNSKLIRCGWAIRSLFSQIFWKEIGSLVRHRKAKPRTLLRALLATSHTLLIESALRRICAQFRVDVIYSYWNDVQAYAAALIKRKGLVGKTVSRAHRFDVYEDQRPDNYMPLKRQFTRTTDQIFAVADSVKTYLQETYGFDPAVVSVSRLGVPVPNILAPTSTNALKILSVSSCTPVKKIDRIVEALRLASQTVSTPICWTHIGGGPLLRHLEQLAASKLKDIVEFKFTGEMTNDCVRNHYTENAVDIFINASESEGIPVSIMEAMSYGVPVIAPSVGGVSELLSSRSGILVEGNANPDEYARAIETLSTQCRSPDLRSAVRRELAQRYDASHNYQSFIKTLLNTA